MHYEKLHMWTPRSDFVVIMWTTIRIFLFTVLIWVLFNATRIIHTRVLRQLAFMLWLESKIKLCIVSAKRFIKNSMKFIFDKTQSM